MSQTSEEVDEATLFDWGVYTRHLPLPKRITSSADMATGGRPPTEQEMEDEKQRGRESAIHRQKQKDNWELFQDLQQRAKDGLLKEADLEELEILKAGYAHGDKGPPANPWITGARPKDSSVRFPANDTVDMESLSHTVHSLVDAVATLARDLKRVNSSRSGNRTEYMDVDCTQSNGRADAGMRNWEPSLLAQPPGPGQRLFQFKPNSFTDPDTEDWLVWRTQFQVLPVTNQWSLSQAKTALLTSLRGPAAAAAVNINLMDPHVSLGEALDALERKFLPPAASRIAKVQFLQAYQKPKEKLLAWHNRCLNLFRKAYPAKSVNDEAVISRFADGIKDNQIRKQVHRMLPETYEQALEYALNEASIEAGDRATTLGTSPKSDVYNIGPHQDDDDGIHVLNGRPGGGARNFKKNSSKEGDTKGTCHFCKEVGHYRPECPTIKRAMEYEAKVKAFKERNKSNPSGPRGPKKGINHLGELAEEYEDDMELTYEETELLETEESN